MSKWQHLPFHSLWTALCIIFMSHPPKHCLTVLNLRAIYRSLLGVGVSTLCLPFSMLNCTLKEVIGFLKRWRRYAFAYEEQRRLTADRKSTDERPLTEPKFTGLTPTANNCAQCLWNILLMYCCTLRQRLLGPSPSPFDTASLLWSLKDLPNCGSWRITHNLIEALNS